MAGTTPTNRGNRTPVNVRVGRSFGDVMKAMFAFIALVLLVAGVPFSLAYFIGWPLPEEMPAADALTEEISTDAFLKFMGVLVWLAWAQFTACVLVEVRAAVSGVGIPRRVPGAGPSQMLARQLVSALLLLSSAAASLTPALNSMPTFFENQGGNAPVAEAQQTPGGDRATDAGGRVVGPGGVTQAEPAVAIPDEGGGDHAESPTKYYRIQPPEGRHHDTLWGIAERHLGDGLRYKEIYQLNKDRVQPDGSRLTEASLIRPGWILEMPADAHGGELVEAPYELEEISEDEAEQISDYAKSGDTEWPDPDEQPDQPDEPDEQPDDTDAERSELVYPPDNPPDGGTDGSGEAYDTEEREESGGEGEAAEEAEESEEEFGLPEALMSAPLLAAGLLLALGRTRRNTLWQSAAGVMRRSVGDGLTPRTPSAFNARDALLVGADPEAVKFLDRALRQLSAALAAAGRVLPSVYAAWLSEQELHLQLSAPAGTPPAPWQMGQGDTYWMIDRSHLPPPPVEGEGPDAEAPYPGLVSLGKRDELRLLLNLEAVPGLVSVTGNAADREAVLTSIAAELATSGWSDRMTVSLVGFGADLTALAPTRVRHLEDVNGLLEVMETESNLRRGALRTTGQDSILTGRTGPARQQQWAPHLVIIGVPPTGEQAERLAALASVSAPLGIGYLVTAERTDLPGTAWEFEVTPDGVLREPVMGLELVAQMLPGAHRSAVVELFTELTREPATGGGAPSDPRAAGLAFLVDLSERGKPEVYAQLMGGYELTGLPDPEPERAAQLREALAMLMLHREGVHPRVLASALWPRGVSDDVRDAFIDRLRQWLGQGADGITRLLLTPDGRLTLGQRVVSDWDVLRTLHYLAVARASDTPADQRKRQLADALSLARGALLDGQRGDGRYGWLEHEIVDAQYPLLVADIALTLAAEQLRSGEAEQAYTAVRTALAAAPMDERLWNELLRAAHATGRQEWLTGAAEWLVAHHAQLFGAGQALPAQTEALLDELLPTWRERVPT
ncbi:BTAD domain-containing putative transcriptional regulator [Streptomyces sp. 6N223]|uniref:BTAD domain-containing putative transcriptional regulator n=1 Tax=Streptomyces sp. 6N223 TaxID=3457412 RepID=UPI003FCF7DE9